MAQRIGARMNRWNSTLQVKTPMKRTAFHASEKIAKQMVRRAISKTPKGERARAMKAADAAFSEWIRLRDSDDNGMVRCVTCGSPMFWRDADCGHFMDRGKQPTRYDERNCHAQGTCCNIFRSGRQFEHGLKVDAIHGPGTADDLLLKSKMDGTRKAKAFWDIATDYRSRVERIREMEPGKYNAEG